MGTILNKNLCVMVNKELHLKWKLSETTSEVIKHLSSLLPYVNTTFGKPLINIPVLWAGIHTKQDQDIYVQVTESAN